MRGGRRAYHVSSMCPRWEGRSSSPVVRHLRRGIRRAPGPDHMPFWPKRDQHLPLVLSDDVYHCFTWVDLSTRSWLPTALMLAVAASAHASAALPKEEVTLSRGFDPSASVPVGYCWQNSRCCRSLRRPQHSHIDDFVSHRQELGMMSPKLRRKWLLPRGRRAGNPVPGRSRPCTPGPPAAGRRCSGAPGSSATRGSDGGVRGSGAGRILRWCRW